MALTILVYEAGAQGHIAAAFTEDHGSPGGDSPQPIEEDSSGCQPSRMELGIATGEIDRIAGPRRRLISQRREENDLGTGFAPSVDLAGINEAIGCITGHGDALA